MGDIVIAMLSLSAAAMIMVGVIRHDGGEYRTRVIRNSGGMWHWEVFDNSGETVAVSEDKWYSSRYAREALDEFKKTKLKRGNAIFYKEGRKQRFVVYIDGRPRCVSKKFFFKTERDAAYVALQRLALPRRRHYEQC